MISCWKYTQIVDISSAIFNRSVINALFYNDISMLFDTSFSNIMLYFLRSIISTCKLSFNIDIIFEKSRNIHEKKLP
jgi:hypothetical protein